MPSIEKIQDLRDVIDRKTHFYLQVVGSPHLPLKVQRINKDTVFVTPPVNKTLEANLSGFLIATGGTGIYHVKGQLTKENKPKTGSANNLFDVAVVDVDLASVIFENRREFYRIVFPHPYKANLRREDASVQFPVDVVDFSAGGLRVRSPYKLELGEKIAVNFSPTIDDNSYDFQFWTTVISNLGALHQHIEDLKDCYGLWMVSPEDSTMRDRRDFSRTQRQMIKFCNDYTAYLRKIAKEEAVEEDTLDPEQTDENRR